MVITNVAREDFVMLVKTLAHHSSQHDSPSVRNTFHGKLSKLDKRCGFSCMASIARIKDEREDYK